MKAVHYSKNPIETGAIITSIANSYGTYQYTWGVYKKVADELGIYFPENYGYAYPDARPEFERYSEYKVEAPDEFVSRCSLACSVMVAMDIFSPSAIRRSNPQIKSLEERDAIRAKAISKIARQYFTPTNKCRIELISDKWVVI